MQTYRWFCSLPKHALGTGSTWESDPTWRERLGADPASSSGAPCSLAPVGSLDIDAAVPTPAEYPLRTQRLQYPLMEEYTLALNYIKDPIFI